VRRSRLLIVSCAVCIALVAASVAWVVAARGSSNPPTRAPAAGFEASPTSGTAPLVVQFTTVSTKSSKSWTWNFGDSTTSTQHNPSHTYLTPGRYTVSLRVAGAGGTSTVTRAGYITVNPPGTQAGWTTIIDDQFNTPGVPSHWLLYSGSYAGDTSSCASPSQVQVPGDGYLHLKMQYRSSGICGSGWYTGGMQIAKAYGGVDQAVTVRWRIVPSADPAVVYSTYIIPMRWVDDPNYAWYQGESDYCEGGSLDGCYIYLHFGPSSQILHGYSVDLTQWHTFRIEQRDHQVSLFIDNLTKPVWVYKGNATTVPDSFKRTVLQQSCPLLIGCPSAVYAGDVEDIQIDWVTIQNATSVGGAS
jgi:PKD repeat protein